MTDPFNKNRLLEEVMGEGEKTDFRCALLAEMLRGARRKRQRRNAGKLAITTLALAFAWLTISTARRFSSRPMALEVAKVTSANTEVDFRIRVVETDSFDRCAVIHTQPLTAGQFVTSQDWMDRGASHVTAKIVSTQSLEKGFSEIGDPQLFALISPHAAALIRDSRGRERLVFLNANDERGFPVN